MAAGSDQPWGRSFRVAGLLSIAAACGLFGFQSGGIESAIWWLGIYGVVCLFLGVVLGFWTAN